MSGEAPSIFMAPPHWGLLELLAEHVELSTPEVARMFDPDPDMDNPDTLEDPARWTRTRLQRLARNGYAARAYRLGARGDRLAIWSITPEGLAALEGDA